MKRSYPLCLLTKLSTKLARTKLKNFLFLEIKHFSYSHRGIFFNLKNRLETFFISAAKMIRDRKKVLDKNVKTNLCRLWRSYLLFASVCQANTIDWLGERYEVIQKCEFDINRWRLFEIRSDRDCRHNCH